MREVLRLPPDRVRPGRGEVLRRLEMPDEPQARHEALLASALGALAETAAPAGVIQGLSTEEFEEVFRGEGRNDSPNPLEGVFPRASALALFAATLGDGVSRRIEALFEAKDFALGVMLDAAASAAAERLAAAMQDAALRRLADGARGGGSWAALRYSPGYCGWHISGQRRFFGFLRPGDAGLELTESFLMAPLKSVCGVVVCGEPGIHEFEAGFGFCGGCRHRTCRERRPTGLEGVVHGDP